MNSSESAVLRGYIETMLELPWDKASRDSSDLKRAEEILNADHYGMEKVKERVLEYLAVRISDEEGQQSRFSAWWVRPEPVRLPSPVPLRGL